MEKKAEPQTTHIYQRTGRLATESRTGIPSGFPEKGRQGKKGKMGKTKKNEKKEKENIVTSSDFADCV